MSRKVNLSDVIRCCESRFSHGKASHWAHRDFSELSLEILEDTGTNISVNTLKRIFGKLSVDENYIPQQATMEALQKYGGYSPAASSQSVPEDTVPTIVIPKNKHHRLAPYFIAVIIVAILGVGAWKLNKQPVSLSGQIDLKKTEGILPSTAIFELKLPDTNDSLFVDFGDKSPLVNINKDQKLITHNYIFSGVFKVSLLVRETLLSQTRISISSDKWIGLSYHDQMRNHFYETAVVKTLPDSLFNHPNSQLQKMGLDTAQRIFTRLYNFSPVKYTEDNFTFETTFKNPPRKNGIACNSTQFQISGINSMIRFKLSSPGCTSRVLNVLSEQRFEGNKDDLSQFVLEQENWSTIRLVNRNKQVTLFVNGKPLFTGSYQQPLGEIKGLFIEFEGNGFVRTCDLTAGDGRNLYHF